MEREVERERESNPEDCFRAAVDQLCRGERERESERETARCRGVL